MTKIEKINCKYCEGTGLGSLTNGSDSRCAICKGKGYFELEADENKEDN